MPSKINAGTQSIDFWEDVADYGGFTAHFEYGNSALTQVITINSTDIITAVNDILGSADVEGGVLVRDTPLRHGLWNSAYATAVDVVGGRKASGKVDLADDFDLGAVGNDLASYVHLFLRITYNTLPYPVDYRPGHGGDEFHRFCMAYLVPSGEVQKIGIGQVQYKLNSNDSTANNKPISYGLSTWIGKGDLLVKWWRVPHEYIFTTDSIPQNFADGLCCVNSTTFQGCPAGTLLMTPNVQFEPINSPSATLEADVIPNLLYNVSMIWKFYDPPINELDAGTYGHNLVPHNDGLFYLATTKTGNRPLYQSYDFAKFFQCVG